MMAFSASMAWVRALTAVSRATLRCLIISTLPVPMLGDGGGVALVDGPVPRSPIPEQPASRRRDAKTASHGEEARAGREFQACNGRNMGPASAATAHHVAASACLQSPFWGRAVN